MYPYLFHFIFVVIAKYEFLNYTMICYTKVAIGLDCTEGNFYLFECQT